MKLAVIGAGLQARAVLDSFVRFTDATAIGVCDLDAERARGLVEEYGDSRVSWAELDVRDESATRRWMEHFDAVLSTVPYRYNLALCRCALEVRTHFSDLGGNHQIVDAQLGLDSLASAAGVSIVPDLGLAPGLAGLLAADLVRQVPPPRRVELRVGGLPRVPEPPLGYRLFFSVTGLINEYVEDCRVLSSGEASTVPGLSGLEQVEFPEPFGELEAFHTSGGVSTLTHTLADEVHTLDYKTIRYKGHCKQIRLLKDLGFFGSEAVRVGEHSVVPRQLSEQLLSRALGGTVEDVVLLRVTVEGGPSGDTAGIEEQLIDYGDPERGLSAMSKCTGYPAAIVAEMQARGELREAGARPQETVVPFELFRKRLKERGIAVERRQWEALT